MKILIIGARGMLGSQLMQTFREWSPVGWDRQEIDITEAGDVQKKLTTFRYAQGKLDVIINAAAYTDVDGAETNRDLALAVNGEGVRKLTQVAKELNALIVHYSTDYVFDGEKKEGYVESDEPHPLSVYGESKLAGEKALKESGSTYYLIRTAWLYGPHGKNFVDKMLQLGKEKDELRVVNDQYGSPTFTKDVAEYTKQLLTKNYSAGIYHAVNSGVATWYDFAREIFTVKKMPVKIEPIPAAEYPLPAMRPHYSVLRNTKGPAMRPWQEALREYLSTDNR